MIRIIVFGGLYLGPPIRETTIWIPQGVWVIIVTMDSGQENYSSWNTSNNGNNTNKPYA